MTPRFAPVDPETMTADQLKLYERFTTGRRADPSSPFRLTDRNGFLLGPAAAWVLSPVIGLALEGLGDSLEQHARVSRRCREFVILMVAHRRQSKFELYAHSRAGRRAGLSDDDLAAIAAGGPPDLQSDEERAIYRLVSTLLERGAIGDADYREAVDTLGIDAVLEVVVLVTYFELVATHLEVFNINPPTDT